MSGGAGRRARGPNKNPKHRPLHARGRDYAANSGEDYTVDEAVAVMDDAAVAAGSDYVLSRENSAAAAAAADYTAGGAAGGAAGGTAGDEQLRQGGKGHRRKVRG
jgi:hypothetical protein